MVALDQLRHLQQRWLQLGLQMARDATFTLPDGNRVVGDEVRFEEDVQGPSHYPYLGFEAIATRSTADSFTVVNEMAEGTGK